MEHITPEDFAKMRQQLNDVHSALIGNPVTNDGGMVKRLTSAETRLEKVEKIGERLGWHFKILWAACGFVVAGIWQLLTKK